MSIRKTKQEDPIYISIYIFCLLPFLSVTGLVRLGDTIYTVWKLLGMCGFVSILFLFFYNEGIRFNKFIILLVIYELLDLFVGVFFYGIIYGRIAVSLTVITLTMLVQYDVKRIIQAILLAGCFIILLNFLSMLFIPISRNEVYFIGGKNQLSMFIIPILILLILYTQEKGRKLGLMEIFLCGIFIASVVLAKSGTGVVAVGVLVLLFIFSSLIKRKRFLFMAYLGMLILLTWGTSLLAENKYWLRFLGALGKDSTLTGRIEIWGNLFKKLKESPAFGIGAGTILMHQDNKIINEAHNILLEILLSTGFIGLIIYALYFYQAIKGLDLKNKKHKTIFLGIIILLVNGLTESINNTMFFTIILAISYYYSTEKNQIYYKRLNKNFIEGIDASIETYFDYNSYL